MGIATGAQRVLQAFSARMGVLSAQIPTITTAAEAAAARAAANPAWKVRLPSPRQPAFTDEFVARSGGLANWGTGRPDDPPAPDVMLYAARSWEEDAAEAAEALPAYRERGRLTVLIASRAGMPAGLPHDFFFDNGAAAGGAEESTVSFIANVALGWMWHVEFVAALTRLGVRPNVLMSVFLPGADEFNATLTPKDALHPCATRMPAGEPAAAYLDRVDRLLYDVAAAKVQGSLERAADAGAEHLRVGGRIVTAAFAHAVPGEMRHAVRIPTLPLGVPTREDDVRAKTQPGDLLLFFGYIGLNSRYYSHGTWFRNAGLRLVTSFVSDPNPDNNAPDALVHIPQSWEIGDAEVLLPFPPGKMAPVSVINQLLLFRMLDEMISRKL